MKLTPAQQEIFDTYTKNNPDLSEEEVSGFLNWLRHKNLDDEVLESCEQSWMEDDNMGDY